MATLPHYTNSKASVNKWEFVAGNLFEVTIIPPPGISNRELLLEHVRTVGGLTTELGQEAVEQEFKTAKRSFLSTAPTNTVVDLAINFTLNLNDDNEMYVYKTLRDWKRVGYNPLTGEMGLKKDYSDAKIIVVMYNRIGDIHWQRTFHDCFINGDLPELALDYSSGDPLEMEVTFRSDYFTEKQA
jgi:hypothetical protein